MSTVITEKPDTAIPQSRLDSINFLRNLRAEGLILASKNSSTGINKDINKSGIMDMSEEDIEIEPRGQRHKKEKVQIQNVLSNNLSSKIEASFFENELKLDIDTQSSKPTQVETEQLPIQEQAAQEQAAQEQAAQEQAAQGQPTQEQEQSAQEQEQSAQEQEQPTQEQEPVAQGIIQEQGVQLSLKNDPTTQNNKDAYEKSKLVYPENMPFSYEAVVNVINQYIIQFGKSVRSRFIPSEEQLRVLYSFSKRLLVESGAGTGKTTIIIIKMFLEQNILRLTNDDILAITYTREGAQSMLNRYNRIRDEFSSTRFLEFKTIHSYCLGVCQAFMSDLKILTEFNDAVDYVWDDEESYYVEHKIKMLDLIAEGITFVTASGASLKQPVTAKSVLSAINTIVEMCITDETEFRNQETYIDFPLNYSQIMAVYEYYNRRKKELGVFDYLDMLTKANEIFQGIIDGTTVPENSYQEKMYTFKSIYIDEVQDISPLQVDIVKKLLILNPEANLTVIGDADQSIYSFRGASVDYIMNFPKIYKDEETLDVIYLTRNRRSAPNIISLSDKFIRNNKNRFPKNLRGLDIDDRVGNISFYEDSVGYLHKNIILNVLKTVKEQNIADLGKYAVLYREHKQATWLINYLVCNHIPFNINLEWYSEEFVMNSKEFKDLIFLSHLIRQPNNADLVKLYLWKLVPAITKSQSERISFDMRSKPTAKLLPYVRKYGTEEDVKEIIALRNLLMDNVSPAVFFKALVKKYKAAYYDNYIRSQHKVDKMQDILDYFEYKKDLGTIQVEIDSDKRWIKLNTRNSASVTLNTFHISKGLEYDNVFILPLSDEVSPKLRKVVRTMTQSGLTRYIEEERRLLYVAITRAKENLCIFFQPNSTTKSTSESQQKTSTEKSSKAKSKTTAAKTIAKTTTAKLNTEKGLFATELLNAYEEVLKEYPEMKRQLYLSSSETNKTDVEEANQFDSIP